MRASLGKAQDAASPREREAIMDRNRAEILRKELIQFLQKQSEVFCNRGVSPIEIDSVEAW